MRLLAALFATFALLTAPAHAAGRGNIFSVFDVAVDVTAADASQARDLGFRQAQSAAYDRLVKRLAAPEDLARLGPPAADQLVLDQLVDGVDILNEGRSGVRYLARMAVNFNPAAMRKLLSDKGLRVHETRTNATLVVPTLVGGTPEQATAWRLAWEQGGFGEELAPLTVAAGLTGPPDWASAQNAAAAAGATSALYAGATASGGVLAVSLVDVSASGRRDLGQFSTPLPAASPDNHASLFRALANAANERIQAEWKQKLGAGAGQRTRVAATVTFTTQAEWLQVKTALAQAAQTLVSDIVIEAVAKDGASLSFSHTGSREQLAAELGRRGVSLTTAPDGTGVRLAKS